MHIALLTEKYRPDVGGLAASAARLARLLAGAGHRVHVIGPSSALAPGQVQCDENEVVTVSRIGSQRRTDATLADWFGYLVAQHQARPFDVLHAYFVTAAGFVAAYAGRVLGVPSVVSARGNDLDRAVLDPTKAAHTLYALQHASAITANTRALVRQAEALAPGRTALLVPNSVDASLFIPNHVSSVKEKIFAPSVMQDAALLGFVGEARAKKGLATLLLAFREVASTHAVALLLVGGARPGDDAATLAVFQKQHPTLPLHVTPYLTPDELPSYYNALDVLLLPSLNEGLPNALLEGMACACAIVATPVGGIPDLLRDGENGVLVPPRDYGALAAAVCRLLDNPARREQLGQAARATVLRDYTPERELAANLELYHRLVG